jgi:hypothetical protein
MGRIPRRAGRKGESVSRGTTLASLALVSGCGERERADPSEAAVERTVHAYLDALSRGKGRGPALSSLLPRGAGAFGISARTSTASLSRRAAWPSAKFPFVLGANAVEAFRDAQVATGQARPSTARRTSCSSKSRTAAGGCRVVSSSRRAPRLDRHEPLECRLTGRAGPGGQQRPSLVLDPGVGAEPLRRAHADHERRLDSSPSEQRG